MKKTLAFFMLFLSSFLFALLSCSASDPTFTSIESAIVFDYKDYSSEPASYLSFFVSSDSSFLRAKGMRLIHEQSLLEWDIEKPSVFKGVKNKDWAGASNLVAAYGDSIPQGTYTLYYEDLAGQECEGTFSLSYPDDFASKKLEDADFFSQQKKEVYIALFNKEKELIFFDKKRDEWTDFRSILLTYPTSAIMRYCYVVRDSNALCLLPEIDLNDKTIENTLIIASEEEKGAE